VIDLGDVIRYLNVIYASIELALYPSLAFRKKMGLCHEAIAFSERVLRA
jgi:hypothetical protein